MTWNGFQGLFAGGGGSASGDTSSGNHHLQPLRTKPHHFNISYPGQGSSIGSVISGAVMFDMEYARWLEDDSKLMTELQGILQAQNLDANLGAIVEECMRHYDELFHLRAMLARSDVFHLMTGLWVTTAERCFLWMGGFRPSEILKVSNAKGTLFF